MAGRTDIDVWERATTRFPRPVLEEKTMNETKMTTSEMVAFLRGLAWYKHQTKLNQIADYLESLPYTPKPVNAEVTEVTP